MVVVFGNLGLLFEEVDLIDILVEWYFVLGVVVSFGYFIKDCMNIFGVDFEGVVLILDLNNMIGGLFCEIDLNCFGGGIFNFEVILNVLGDLNIMGLCVDFICLGNDFDIII